MLAAVTLLSYGCGMLIGAANDERRKRAVLVCGVVGNVAILAGMKYLPFLAESVDGLAALMSLGSVVPKPPILLSVGVSFFVFQAIGYLIDIYLELEEPERHAGIFALSLAFFPKLLQGPIERSRDVAAQLREPYRFDYAKVRSGMLLFLWGAFKKMVVADRLAVFVDTAYANPVGMRA